METQNTYNGWTNYATWRIALEIFDGYEFGYEVSAQECEEFAEEIIFQNDSDTLADSYARAFLSDVNYHEIADHLNESFNEN
jgi:hypothetical protein